MMDSSPVARGLRVLVRGFSVLAALAVLVMMAVTCLDILLRLAGHPLRGVYDIVRLAGAVAIVGAIPHTTAAKGHVAIEYFFHRLGRRGRVLVDSLTRGAGVGLFGLLSWRFVRYGLHMRRIGQVTETLQIPAFWAPWLMAVSLAVTALVILYHLLRPGRALVRP